MLERRREPRLSWNCTAPFSEANLACRKSTGESGGIQAPGACGPGLQGAWGPGPQGLGPGPPGAWGLFPQKPPNLSNYDFFANLLLGAWRRRGCRLRRLLRRSPPTPPRFGAVREKGRGFSPSPPSATIQHAPQGRRTAI